MNRLLPYRVTLRVAQSETEADGTYRDGWRHEVISVRERSRDEADAQARRYAKGDGLTVLATVSIERTGG